MRSRRLRRRQHAVKIRLGITEGDVARDRLVEYVVFLQNHADVPPHIAVVQSFQVNMIEEDRAFGRLEQSGDEFNQRCLAAAAATDEGHHLSGGEVEIDVIENIRRLGPAIFKTDPAQFDAPLQAVHRHETRAVMPLFRFLLEDIVQAIQ